MRIMFACTSDHASVEQSGKLNVSGIFDRINATGFPTQVPKLCLVFRLLFDYDDNDKENSLEFSLEDADGQKLMEASAQIKHDRVLPGAFATANQIFEMNNMIIAHEGRYKFVFIADGERAFEVPFDVARA